MQISSRAQAVWRAAAVAARFDEGSSLFTSRQPRKQVLRGQRC